jgi:hypothetical protein
VPQHPDHSRLQATARLRVKCGIDCFVPDAPVGVIGGGSLGCIARSPPAICSGDQPKCTSLPRTQVCSAAPSISLRGLRLRARRLVIATTRCLWSVVAVLALTMSQFPAGRRGMPTQKRSDRPRARPSGTSKNCA